MPSRQMGTGELPGASSLWPLCVPRAQPLASVAPAGTTCLQFLSNDDNTSSSGRHAGSAATEMCTVQSPACH